MLIAGKTFGIIRQSDEITKIFINLGGLESLFCLFSRSDDIIRREIVAFLIDLGDKYYPSLFENQIFVEQLRLVLDSESTLREVLIMKFLVIY